MPGSRETSSSVEVPPSGYRRSMWANRFRLDWVSGQAWLGLVLASDQGVLLDSFSLLIPKAALLHQKRSLLQFLDKLPAPPAPAPLWSNVLPPSGTEVVDIMAMGNGEMGEICFSNFAMRGMQDHLKSHGSSSTIRPTPVAMVRCESSLLHHLITALYSGDRV